MNQDHQPERHIRDNCCRRRATGPARWASSALLLALIVALSCAIALGSTPAAQADLDQPAGSGSNLAAEGGRRTYSLGAGITVTPAAADRPMLIETAAGAGAVISAGPLGTVISGLGPDATTRVLDARRAPARPPRGTVLDLSAIARDGRATNALVMIFDVRTGRTQMGRSVSANESGAPCSTAGYAVSNCAVVPPGVYSILAYVWTMPAGVASVYDPRTVQSVSLVGSPEVLITRDRPIVFDARRAVAQRIWTPERTEPTQQGLRELGYTRTAANGQQFQASVMPIEVLDDTFYLEPGPRIRIGQLQTRSRVVLERPTIEATLNGRPIDLDSYDTAAFADFDSEFPHFDGRARLRVVDVGTARPADLTRQGPAAVRGAAALVRRDRLRSVAVQANAAAAAGAKLVIIGNDRAGDDPSPGTTGTKLTTPTVRVDASTADQLRRAVGRFPLDVTGEPASDVHYDLVIKTRDRLIDPTPTTVQKARLARQDRVFYGLATKPTTVSEAAYHWQPGERFSVSVTAPVRQAPRHRTEYRIADPETRWSFGAQLPETLINREFPHDPVLSMRLADPTDPSAFAAGSRTRLEVGAAPIAATFVSPVQRLGDELLVSVASFGDRAGNYGVGYTDPSGLASYLGVRADGVLVGETTALPSGTAALPAGASTVEIDYRLDNPQPWAELSTSTRQTWRFPSRTVTGDQPAVAPVLLPRWDVPVDLRNTVRRSGPFDIGLALDQPPGAVGVKPLTKVEVETSYDDGKTWRRATVRPDGSVFGVAVPAAPRPTQAAKPSYVSLRLTASDQGKSQVSQTIVRAFAVAP